MSDRDFGLKSQSSLKQGTWNKCAAVLFHAAFTFMPRKSLFYPVGAWALLTFQTVVTASQTVKKPAELAFDFNGVK